ncbi:hypothetical protein [Amycolatopsis alkalitolerans]|uniref:hypothetical protein n=1 Tax=Amycolatopsis alkalitolerans TaxID=2547244 RepID=UPI003899596D
MRAVDSREIHPVRDQRPHETGIGRRLGGRERAVRRGPPRQGGGGRFDRFQARLYVCLAPAQ